MKLNPVLCEAIEVKTSTGTCIGIARVRQGEKVIIDGRTPVENGMCSNAFCALSNAAFVMMTSEKSPGEQNGAIERVCPHGNVVYKLSRSTEEKQIPFSSK